MSREYIILISHLSALIWLFILAKHYKKEFFNIFLFLNLSTVAAFIMFFIFSYNTNGPMIFFSLLVILELIKKNFPGIKFKIFFVAASLAVSLFSFIVNLPLTSMSFLLIICVIIIALFIRKIILNLAYNAEVNLLHLLLLFYFLTVLFKLNNALLGVNLGMFYFVIFEFIHILFGISFCFITEKTKVFRFNPLT